jgi:hypothetical protein
MLEEEAVTYSRGLALDLNDARDRTAHVSDCTTQMGRQTTEGLDMKRGEALLIAFLAISGASADSSDVRPPPRTAHAASIANLVQEVRATTAFVKEQANTATNRSRWLTAVAGCGLVMLQLRRKHKSLPQRRIAPYG